MIVVTGGAGFIGSNLIKKLNEQGHDDIIIVDRLGTGDKWKNLNGLKFTDIYHKDKFLPLVEEENVPFHIDAIIHLGACSSTTEKDADYLAGNNYGYSQALVKYSLPRRSRFIYASSAATYGDGANGYDDKTEIEDLRPLNMYGYSKQMFDVWIKRSELTDHVVGLKYFNVYGPKEEHKDDMRSVVNKAYSQIMETGKVQLFKSYKDEYKDGEQLRDFIYVDDAVNMTLFFLEHQDKNGLYNVGTGQARSWNDLVTATFDAAGKPVNIEYIDMPDVLKGKYQYFTEAKIEKIKEAGFDKPINSLEDGVKDYVQNYLVK